MPQSAAIRFRPLIGVGALVILLAVALVGCISLEAMAPSVSPALAAAGQTRGFSADQLALGRQLYLTRCTACHSAEPVDFYTPAQWEPILLDMSEKAHLEPAQSRAVRAYVLTAHHYLASQPAPSASGATR